MENQKLLPVFANTIGYHVSATDIVLDFGFLGTNPQDGPIIHSRIVMAANVIEPFMLALETLQRGREEAKLKALAEQQKQ